MRQYKKFLYFMCFFIGLTFFLNKSYAIDLDKVEGKTFFTKANIWYERPEEILSTNFHRGQIISVGTKVIIERVSKKEILFSIENEDTLFHYVHAKKHSTITISELFDRYFSEENIIEQTFNNFSEQEQKNIQNGTIDVGMSKEAVLIAFGYPPSHRTTRLSNNIWMYWRSRVQRTIVYFKNNKISRIEE